MIDKPEHNEVEAEADYQQPEPPTKTKGVGFALFIAFLALFFTAAGIAAGYRHWQRMNDKAKENAAHIAQLQEALASKTDSAALDALRTQLNETVTGLQDSSTQNLQRMAQIKQQTEQSASDVAAQVEQITLLQARLQQTAAPGNPKEWKLEEASFLLKLANQELYLTGNKDAAIAALKEAGQQLSTNGSVTYLPVRKQVARDVAALEAYSPPNLAEISQQITSLMLSLSPTPPPQANNPEGQPAESGQASEAGVQHESIWEQYRQKAMDTLSGAIVVHQLDQPLASTLDNESRQSLFQLMQLRLESLRLMALQRQDKNYHQQIALIRDSLPTYYSEAASKPLAEQLQALDSINLEPTPPDISGSLRQLEKARQTDLAGEKQP